MTTYFASDAYLQNGWANDVRITVNASGTVISLDSGAAVQSGDIHLSGPVIPSMPNCHSHAFQRAFAGLSEFRSSTQDSFWSWRSMMYKFLARLTPEDVRTISSQLYIEMLKAGYTAVGEFHYLHNNPDGQRYDNRIEMAEQVILASEQTGIKLTLLPVLYRYAGFGRQEPSSAQGRFILSIDDYLELFQQLAGKQSPNRLRLGVAPHSLRAVDIADIATLLADIPTDTLCHIHIAEQIPEVEQCKNYSGLRPIEYLYDNVNVDERWSLIHATHLVDGEITAIQQSGAVIGICPTTEASLGDGIINPDVFEQPDAIRWAIGSDSHISVDPLEELRLLEYGQRLISQQRVRIVASDNESNGQSLWTSAVSAGARSIGQGGVLRTGCQADWLVLDNNHASLCSLESNYLLDALIFSNRTTSPVKDVYVNGECVIRDRRHPAEDTALYEYQALLTRLMSDI